MKSVSLLLVASLMILGLQVKAESVTLTGNLQRIAAVGGETTGFVVSDVEVDFERFPAALSLPEGTGLVVVGTLEERQGTLRPYYQVLVAREVKISVTGKFVRMMAIGAETSGLALQTEEGRLLEVIAPASQLPSINAKIESETEVEVQGHLATRNGVSRKSFNVLVLEQILN